jgi:hypothetical protein
MRTVNPRFMLKSPRAKSSAPPSPHTCQSNPCQLSTTLPGSGVGAWDQRREAPDAASSLLADMSGNALSWTQRQRALSVGTARAATFALVLATLIVGDAATARRAAGPLSEPTRPPRWDIPVRMLAATAIVVLITALARMPGSHLAGLLSPFPVFGAVLAIFTYRPRRVLRRFGPDPSGRRPACFCHRHRERRGRLGGQQVRRRARPTLKRAVGGSLSGQHGRTVARRPLSRSACCGRRSCTSPGSLTGPSPMLGGSGGR